MPYPAKQRFYFCPKCSGPLTYQPQKGRPRLTCQSCAYIFYENPVVGVAGILLNSRGQILLGRRLSSRYRGLWCIPCGYLEYDEDLYEGLKREFREETALNVEIQELFTALSNFHDPQTHSVGIWFLVRTIGGTLSAGDDLDELSFFSLDSLPPLACPTDAAVLAMLREKTGRRL